ncbi:MAG: DUF3313 family protein [Gammaproteobacteria bacterium]|nr:DUF3313 family protein [Gammaproteobacteria bacterium]
MSALRSAKKIFCFKKTLVAIAVSSSIVLGASSLTGCQSTQPMYDDIVETEFLTDSSLLQSVPDEPGKRFYEKENVDWSQYHSVMIEDVTINDADNADGMSRRDRLMMGIYFQNSMRMSVQKKYVVTNRPDTGVLIIRASISDATTGSSLSGAMGGEYGNVVIEGEIIDAMSGEPLVAIIDRQDGEFLSAYSDWDDVAIAFDDWSEQLYGLLQSHMESRPAYQDSTPSGVSIVASTAANSVTTSRAHIDVDKEISSVASQYEQQQYAQIIDEQLIAAAGDLKADRLTAPPGRNAMERYNHVLDMDPNNAHAKDGLNIIASRYLGWAEMALTNGETNKSSMYLSRAKHINSSSDSIRHSIAKVEEKLNNPSLNEAEAIAAAQVINNNPPAMGYSQPAQSIAHTPPARTYVAPTTTTTVAATPVVPVKTAPKPTPVAQSKPVQVAQVQSTPQPSPVVESAPEVESQPEQIQALAQTVEVTAASEPVVAPPPPKVVEEYDPWRGVDMGNAKLNGSKLRPFVLGLSTNGNMTKIVNATKKRLAKAGFDVVGEYSPYNKATIIIVTNQAMKSQASKSEFGGYGAAIRVSVTQAGGKIQVSYTNPYYTQNIYRMKGDASATAKQLSNALGHQKLYGSTKGIAANDLRDWHYMFGMPYFDDQITLQKGSSYKSLVKTIDSNLSNGKNGTKKVYRIDIPGKDETVFGVAISKGAGSDRTVMGNIDVANVKHSAHLPYEVLVSGNKAYMLNGKFRIALSFPDLTMGQFMTISSAPDSTESTMKSIVSPGAQLSSN